MTVKHLLLVARDGGAYCNCGYDPRIVLGKDYDWNDDARVVADHVAKGRRWKYLGAEEHCGERYHVWENELSKRKFAWHVPKYRFQTGTMKPLERLTYSLFGWAL